MEAELLHVSGAIKKCFSRLNIDFATPCVCNADLLSNTKLLKL